MHGASKLSVGPSLPYLFEIIRIGALLPSHHGDELTDFLATSVMSLKYQSLNFFGSFMGFSIRFPTLDAALTGTRYPTLP